ncbi:hypothetical protein TEA_018378 [Camellia sinensis var. sinensis]|uniref:Uncharacterized protein n=1 Tax=Camellia sinensis var. sinensis TaxID=542762 RepID=A0A4S4DTH3_CAMSN|nr:hypothetical protein TEA_018378 [Camellia sinensis var. sinensis]
MIWSWAEVTAEQVEGPTVYGAELINYLPGNGLPELGPGRVWTECVPPRTVRKLLGQEVTGQTRMLGPRMVETRQTERPAPGKARYGLLQPGEFALWYPHRVLHSRKLSYNDCRPQKPIEVSTPKYVEYLMDWIESQLDDESIFPQRLGAPFSPDFREVVKTIFKRLFRVYAHIYHSHFQKIKFGLIDKKELASLQELVESIVVPY